MAALKRRADSSGHRRESDPLRATPGVPLHEARLRELVGYQLAQASVVTADVFRTLAGQPNDLTKVEYTMLSLIDANPGVSPVQLCKALNISKPYVTTRLEKLQSRKLIARDINENDRRGQHLRITRVGGQLVQQITDVLLAGERERFSTLSQAEQSILAELLHKLGRARARG